MWRLFWSTNVKKLSTLATLAAALISSIVGLPSAWEAMGLPEVASRLYVREQIHPVQMTQQETTRAVYQLTLEQLKSSLYAAEQDQIKAPSTTVDHRVDDLKEQIEHTQAKLNAAPAH